MSGGVDSSVAAALLKKEGYDVTGVHMVCVGPPIGGGCENSADRRDAMKVAACLGISFETWDFREEYKKEVYDYMISEYMAGRTPNPDVMCNKQIKFGVFFKKALENGVNYIATGHYVKCDTNPRIHANDTNRKFAAFVSNSRHSYRVFQAKDQNKDQSYFLWTLTQDQLKHCLFPIGNYLKSEVRELAKKFKLPVSEKKDSQGLCFVGKVNFLDFLKEKIPTQMGDILDSFGKKIGAHEGAYFYTIGQRHGLNLGGQKNPVYVAEKDIVANTVTVSEEKDEVLYRKEIEVHSVNWIISNVNATNYIRMPQICARIRYRQPLQSCTIRKFVQDSLFVDFDSLQRAVSSGQSIVFYSKIGEILGGGIIK